MKTDTREPTLDNYTTSKFKREVMQNVSRLAQLGRDSEDPDTVDRAGDLVAKKYRADRGAIAWTVLRTDWLKERHKSADFYILAASDEPKQLVLPGIPKVPIPKQLLIDDKIVERGDPEMTLQRIIDDFVRAEAKLRADADAYKLKADDLFAKARALNKEIKNYRLLAVALQKKYHVGPEELVYDEKENTFAPRAGA